MKKITSIIILCLGFSFSLKAQSEIVGNEQYNSYEVSTYIDNLNQKLTSKPLSDLYYKKINQSECKVKYQEIDEENKRRNIYIYTKKAKNGYLLVNKKITDKMQKLEYNIEKLTISYILNNQIISTKEEVNKLLKLKEKDIVDLDISINENTHLLTANISTK